MRLLVRDLSPGQNYKVQLRSNDGVSVSEWSQLIDLVTNSDAVAPSPITSLSWVVEGTAFVGTWVAPTTNADGSVLNDFRDYQVTIFSSSLPAEKAIYYSASLRFDLPYEVNSNAFTAPRASVTIEVRARDTSGNLSTVVTATATNPVPATVTGLVVTGGQGSISSAWTPVADADLKYYEIYMSTVSGFTPSGANLITTTTANNFTYAVTALTTWYVKVRAVDIFGSPSAAYASGNATSTAITDGIAPSVSPVSTVIGAIGALYVRWTPITNNDPVTYVIHVGTTFSFTPSSATLIGETKDSFVVIRALPGPIPLPGDPDTRTLLYDTDYFVKIIAKDDDGAAAANVSVNSARVLRSTGVDIAANTVAANNIVANTFVGDEFAGTVFIGNTFKTASTGQRLEFGIDGYKAYKSTGALKFSVTADDTDSFIDGEFIARGLTVTGGASFQSQFNEVTADSAITLMRGIVAPSATPTLTINYDTLFFSSASLTTAQKTSVMGTFELIPTQVSHIEWKPSGTYWVIHQIRSNGTRAWFFETDGTPKDITGGGQYVTDVTDWEKWSTTEITSGANAGVYTIFRHMVGAGTDYYVSGPLGFAKYTRLNSSQQPCIGNDGTNMFIAEVVGSSLKVNYYQMVSYTGSIPNLPAPTAQHSSATSYATSLCCCEYNTTGTGGFDLVGGGATHRYATAERGVAYSARTVYQTGAGPNNIFPGSSGGWASSTVNTESWESPTNNRRGMAWDGANFWTYGGDGFLYKHEGVSTQFDPSVNSNKWWAQVSFYDSDATGGTHETMPGLITSLTMKRRAKLIFTIPSIPDNGGVDDPDKVKLYMGRGATQPANSAMWNQSGTGGVSTAQTVTTLATGTTNPLTAGTFPLTNPALIKNDDSSLVISGNGSIIANAFTLESRVVHAPIIIKKTADQTVTSSATLVSDTHLTFTGEANASYIVQAVLFVEGGGSTASDFKLGLVVPSGSAWYGGGLGPDLAVPSGTTNIVATAGTNWNVVYSTANNSIPYGLNGNTGQYVMVCFNATVVMGVTGGAVSMQWAQNVAGGAGVYVRVKANSYMRADKF